MEIMRADITDRVTAIFVEVLGVKATEVRENALIVDTCKLGNAASRRRPSGSRRVASSKARFEALDEIISEMVEEHAAGRQNERAFH
ncbi:hypothetical protein [Sinorhizobium sp. Sb3]|uniref:hypothetical protein n=1 Tax=Sinorhizobium/Ensifer group TaxID=227292 RepID=UPI00071CBC23|nr:hypothetical protein [Sinorhizobium sp. Sb3]KSV63994.1 hypothetical protein N183_35155 [Sinorhizobium sp. Sb3]